MTLAIIIGAWFGDLILTTIDVTEVFHYLIMLKLETKQKGRNFSYNHGMHILRASIWPVEQSLQFLLMMFFIISLHFV